MITQKELKEILHYNPDTGVFTNIVTRYSSIKGTVAGNNFEYVRIGIRNKSYKAHRLAWLYMYGSFPSNQIDHINGLKLDNRIINLRDVDCSENGKNKRIRSNNSSGVTGVSYISRDKVWRPSISINKKAVSLGYFSDKFEAICCRKSAENKYGYHQNHGRLE